MGSEKFSKLNALQADLPSGLLASAAWLRKKGYSDQLLRKYKQGKWLERPARGVYHRPGLPLKWQSVVASPAREMDPPPHIGGITAIELQGRAHFVPLGKDRPVHLWGEARLPSWVNALPGLPRFVFHKDSLFKSADAGRVATVPVAKEQGGPFDTLSNDALRGGLDVLRWGEWDWELPISTLERAILEVLDDVPQHETVEHAKLLLENLRALSPRRLSVLLEDCASIKVKRLFLALAERQNHAWFEALDLGRVTLGAGKRVLEPGGKYDAKYRITLPRDIDDRY
ncbi:MAG: type IV toxin-antitoxin system AbiEi family antitoxin [Anaerolineae bacterium]|nr:type IV toxin-antitoxin system AbiEi family antitoxin [Anaerolineae bacterium]